MHYTLGLGLKVLGLKLRETSKRFSFHPQFRNYTQTCAFPGSLIGLE